MVILTNKLLMVNSDTLPPFFNRKDEVLSKTNSEFPSREVITPPKLHLGSTDKDQISFINYSQKYCVGFVDIVDSTREISKIKNPMKLRKYYSLFLNSMSSIITIYKGKIVKNGGDNFFFYFPKTSDISNDSSFHEH